VRVSEALGEAIRRRPETLFAALIAWQLSFWVLAPILAYGMLPLDTLEAVAWGKEWQAGYYKHPPLGAWLAELAVQAGSGRLGALYGLAQLTLVLALVYVWLTARRHLDPVRAVLATVLLGGSYFHTVLIPNFNMNSLQLPLWAGLGYHFLRLLEGAQRHWWPFALFCALAILAKYSSLLIVASCGLLLLALPEGRRELRSPRPWLTAAFCLLLLAPHLLWLGEHWRLPLAYLAGFEAQGGSGALAHLIEPLRFAAGALLSLLGSALLLLFLLDRHAPWPRPDRRTWILLALVAGPLLLTLLYGAISGSRLKTTWAFPFFSLAGLLALRFLPTSIEAARLGRFALALAAFSLLTAGLHLGYKLRSDRSKTAMDGPALALAVQRAWRESYGTALPIVAGNHIHTAIVAAYAPDRPAMLIDGDLARSTWLQREDLAQGLALLCPAGEACLPELAAQVGAPSRIEVSGLAVDLYLVPPASRE
jgi:4-amino-4-deoxy-L-arabinose transferase-like glycosyltransferase